MYWTAVWKCRIVWKAGTLKPVNCSYELVCTCQRGQIPLSKSPAWLRFNEARLEILRETKGIHSQPMGEMYQCSQDAAYTGRTCMW